MSDRVKSERRPASSRPEMAGGKRLLPKNPLSGVSLPRHFVTRNRLIAGLGCLFAGAIVVNAVVLQNEKHPSPLFRTVAKANEAFPVPPVRPDVAARNTVAPAPVQTTAAKPTSTDKPKAPEKAAAAESSDALVAEIQRELGKRGYFKGDATGKVGPTTTQAIRDFQFAQRMAVDGKPSEPLLNDIQASKVTMKDELVDLLKRTAGTEDKTVKTVSDVQKALNKVGYGPLSEDGQLGPSTKQALAKFEAEMLTMRFGGAGAITSPASI